MTDKIVGTTLLITALFIAAMFINLLIGDSIWEALLTMLPYYALSVAGAVTFIKGVNLIVED